MLKFMLGLLSGFVTSLCEECRGALRLSQPVSLYRGWMTPLTPSPSPLNPIEAGGVPPLAPGGTHLENLQDQAACTCPARPAVFSRGGPGCEDSGVPGRTSLSPELQPPPEQRPWSRAFLHTEAGACVCISRRRVWGAGLLWGAGCSEPQAAAHTGCVFLENALVAYPTGNRHAMG